MLPNAKINTSHVLLALLFLCPSPQPDFSNRKEKQKQRGKALQFRGVLSFAWPSSAETLPYGGSRCENVLFGAKIWPQVGCEQGRTGKENKNNEFKPVGFNQASAWVLGDKLYGLKKKKKCASVWTCWKQWRILCSGVHGSQVQGIPPPPALPSPATHLGFLHAILLEAFFLWKIMESGQGVQMSWKNGGGKKRGWEMQAEISDARLARFYLFGGFWGCWRRHLKLAGYWQQAGTPLGWYHGRKGHQQAFSLSPCCPQTHLRDGCRCLPRLRTEKVLSVLRATCWLISKGLYLQPVL